MFRTGIIALVVLIVGGCGTSETIMTNRYEKLESWQICKKILEDDLASWQIPWANNVLNSRGDNCEKYIGKFQPKRPSQDAGTALIQSLGKALQQHGQQQPQYIPAPAPPPMPKTYTCTKDYTPYSQPSVTCR